MTDKDMREIVRLRGARMGYGRISHQLGIPLSMVKSYCRRNNLFGSAGGKVCMQCGHPLEQVPHRKKKKFCSDGCRITLIMIMTRSLLRQGIINEREYREAEERYRPASRTLFSDLVFG